MFCGCGHTIDYTGINTIRSYIMLATRIAAIAGTAAALTACTTNPYTGEQQASKAATYGVGAAAVCGLVGAMDSKKKARNAALGCGMVGAGVGAYMDVQEAKLREQLQGTGVRWFAKVTIFAWSCRAISLSRPTPTSYIRLLPGAQLGGDRAGQIH